MDQNELSKMLGAPPEGSQPQATPQQQPQAQNLMGAIQAGMGAIQVDPQQASGLMDSIGKAMASTPGVAQEGAPITKEQGLEAGTAGGMALATGGMKSVFETSDFLFGEPEAGDKSAFRQSIEQTDSELKAAHPVINGLASGIGQFAVAMVGFETFFVDGVLMFDTVLSLEGRHPKPKSYSTEAVLYGILGVIELMRRLEIQLQGSELCFITELDNYINAQLNKPEGERVKKRYRKASGKIMGQADLWAALDNLQARLGFKLSGQQASTPNQVLAYEECGNRARSLASKVFSPITEAA